jgi:hypothetical protein
MGQIGIGAGGGAVSGFLSGASFGGAVGGGVFSLPGALLGGIIGAVVGAGVGVLGAYLAMPKPIHDRKAIDLITTQQVRNIPVAVPFGRTRQAGVHVQVGDFWDTTDFKKQKTPGRHIKTANTIIALCEGQIQQYGNLRLQGQTIKYWENNENLPCRMLALPTYTGTGTQFTPFSGPPHVLDGAHGFNDTPQIPYRNTALIQGTAFSGEQMLLPDINIDTVGIDFTIRRQQLATGESNPGDVALMCSYDGYTESFYYTVSASTATTAPFGLFSTGRHGQARQHTPPPTAMGGSAIRGWYWGKHDLLILADPFTTGVFWIGWWGIGITDPGWQRMTPQSPSIGAGYAAVASLWFVDEQHSMLHSLHDDGATRYILRWNVLTGRVDRTDTTLPTGVTYYAMSYSLELASYIVGYGSGNLAVISVDTGETVRLFTSVPTAGALAVWATGQQVACLQATAYVFYQDIYVTGASGVSGGYGDPSANDVTPEGSLGNVNWAAINTFTGQVCMTKPVSGTAAFILFIPSCVEDIRDLSANGTGGLAGLPLATQTGFAANPTNQAPEPEFQTEQIIGSTHYPRSPVVPEKIGHCVAASGIANTNAGTPPVVGTDTYNGLDPKRDWCRDWSYRTYNAWNLVALQGNSSLAGAAWSMLVPEISTGSSRFGAGFNPSYFSLPSFEGLHAYCCGPVRMNNPGASTPPTRLAERYKFDFLLDQPKPVSSFISDDIMMACQGYHYTVGGILYVGIPKPGLLPTWHFSDRQTEDSSLGIAYVSKSDGINRVRVQYRNILNDYQHDFAEAEDANDIQVRGRVQLAELNAEGCGRYDSAILMAKFVLDQSTAGRRQASLKTNYVGYIITPGDGIELSNAQCQLARVTMRVGAITDDASTGKKNIKIEAIEYKRTIDSLDDHAVLPSVPGSTGTVTWGDQTDVIDAPVSNGISEHHHWFNGMSAFGIGNYLISYVSGAYAKTPTGTSFFAAGYNVITKDPTSGLIVPLASAPTVADPGGGYPDYNSVEAANIGQSVVVTLTANGPIGIEQPVGMPAFDTGSGPEKFALNEG